VKREGANNTRTEGESLGEDTNKKREEWRKEEKKKKKVNIYHS
jgi:hypothetical protein